MEMDGVEEARDIRAKVETESESNAAKAEARRIRR